MGDPEREERILMRRQRVEERIRAKELEEGKGVVGEAHGESSKPSSAIPVKEECENGAARAQVLTALRDLAALRAEIRDETTWFRVRQAGEESTRRRNEAGEKQKVRRALLKEAEEAAAANSLITEKWEQLFAISAPEELVAAITAQQAECTKITESKNVLINELKTQLISKDDEYFRLLGFFSDDIDKFLHVMESRRAELKQAYASQLEAVERAFLLDRSEVLKGNKAEVESFLEKRRQLEHVFLDDIQALREDYSRQLEEIRIADAEEYTALKIRLENEIQHLEQHLETMRAIYQLNSEKLDYNYKVLIERDSENQATISQQKRKIARLRDAFSGLKTRYTEADLSCRAENTRLTEEYARVTRHLRQLQRKAKDSVRADAERFVALWDMKAEETAALVSHLRDANDIIREQQLGLPRTSHPPSLLPPPPAGVIQSSAKHTSDLKSTGRCSRSNESTEGAASEADRANKVRDKLEGDTSLDPFIDALCQDVGFLAPETPDQTSGDSSPKTLDSETDSRYLRCKRAVQILAALGIRDVDALDRMIEFVGDLSTGALHRNGHGAVDKPTQEQDSETDIMSDEDAYNDVGQDSSDDGSKALGTSFINKVAQFAQNERLAVGELEPSEKAPDINQATLNTAEAELEEQSEAVAAYWQSLGNTVGPKATAAWKTLEASLTSYNTLLQDRKASFTAQTRARLIRDISVMQNDNAELKVLIQQYSATQIDKELQIPPDPLPN